MSELRDEASDRLSSGVVSAPGRRWVAAGLSRLVYMRLDNVLASISLRFAEERSSLFNWLPVVYGLGIGAYFALHGEPALAAAALPLVIGIIGAALAPQAGLRKWTAVALIVGGLGFLNAKIRTEWVSAPVLDRTVRAVEVAGVLERREPHAKRGERLTLRLTSIARVEPDRLPQRARIRVMTAAGDIRPGDTLRLTATLSGPAPPAIPGGYDFARTAFFERIGAVGYALKPPQILKRATETEPPLALRVRAAVEYLRQQIAARIAAALPGERGAMATALITGERGGITQETTDAYRDSGLIHILSISGLHMAIMAGAVFAIIRLVLAAVPRIALTQPIKKWAAVGGAIAAVTYYAISGGSAATLRATLMMLVFFSAIMLGRPAIAMRNVAIAALLILLVFPEALLDVGFQMSFAAVAALVSAYEFVRSGMERRGLTPGPIARAGLFLGGIVFSTVIAGLAVTPLSIYHFHAMQHYAPLANLIAVPVCNLIVMPAALATLLFLPFGLESGPLWLMALGIDAMGATARTVSSLPGAVTTIPQIPKTAFALILTGGLWLVIWQRRWRLAGLPLIMLGVALAPLASRPDILVGREGALVAIRDASGRLKVHAQRPSNFELKRWLEHDGDSRAPAGAVKGVGFRCDPMGCSVNAEGKILVASRHPGSLADDCERAEILIVSGERPAQCPRPQLIFDRQDLRRSGTVALYGDGAGGFHIETVADARGRRPWTAGQEAPQRPNKPPLSPQDEQSQKSRGSVGIGRYAPSQAALEALLHPLELRPDVEDGDP